MPANFLTDEQNKNYCQFPRKVFKEQLDKYFHLDDKDITTINACRRDYNKLGYALQLTTARFIGTFLPNPIDVPKEIIQYLAKQLEIYNITELHLYLERKATRSIHVNEIKQLYGYRDFEEYRFQITRYLYNQAWYGNERPSILFERCTLWLIDRRILLPGISTLVALISRVRDRVTKRLWSKLAGLIDSKQKVKLQMLLKTPDNSRYSRLDQLKYGPTNISSTALIQALNRYKLIRDIGIRKLNFSNIPKAKINNLARYVAVSWAAAISRMPENRKIAVLVSFLYVYEVKALDDAIDMLDAVINEIVANAIRIGEKNRIRSLGDLDKAALELAKFADTFIKFADSKELVKKIFKIIPKKILLTSINKVQSIARPEASNQYLEELVEKYKTIRRFLPSLLNIVDFKATLAGEPMLKALKFLMSIEKNKYNKSLNNAPLEIVNSNWKNIVTNPQSKEVQRPGYTLCAMSNLQSYLRSRDIYFENSERWCDPRAKLLSGKEWDTYKHPVCKSLNLSLNFDETFNSLSNNFENKYKEVLGRLANNNAVEIIRENPKKPKLKLSKLERVEESESLTALRNKIAELLPRIDLPELLLEVNRMTGFTNELSHISETNSRVKNIEVSLCAILMSEACNIDLESVIKKDVPSLTRNRLSWVQQNCIRAETLTQANACLVDYHHTLPLALKIGGGDVASADGLRFTCGVRTVNSGANSKYFGASRGITYYNFTSNQCANFHGIVVPGTLRDSLFLIDGMQDQQTGLNIKEIMTDTAGASDVVFAIFWLLGYLFSPRLSDIGKAKFWRINPDADYGEFNDLSKHKINVDLIRKHWEDILRIAVSLKLGYVSASELIRSLFRNGRASGLANALINLGRIIKTMYLLNYIDDEDYRRHILTQLNKGESRHFLARTVYYGRHGEIYEKYREGQEDQLNALGLVTNAIVVWNTVYTQKVIDYLRSTGETVTSEDEAKLSLLLQGHINFLGNFAFILPEEVENGFLRPLSLPEDVGITE